MMSLRTLVSLAAAFASGACVHPATNAQMESNASVITEAEIDASGAATAYDAIRKLRSNFLTSRGKTTLMNTSTDEPTVYVDEQPFGLLSALKTIPASQVGMIRLYRAWEAATKYGTGNMGGVIAVTTRR